MNFFEKLKKAILKIKGKLIVSAILILVIIVWGVAPFSVAMKNASSNKIDLGNGKTMWASAKEEVKFNWETLFMDIGYYITHPLEAVKLCLTQSTDTDVTRNYSHSFLYVTKWFLSLYGIAVLIGIINAFPKHEYDDIEHGSSDWSENGEQYKVLHKSKGVILAEKNYLPVDKRGNVNVLVVRRFWSW